MYEINVFLTSAFVALPPAGLFSCSRLRGTQEARVNDNHEQCFCVWAREYACVCARSERRDTVVSKPLYPYVAHHSTLWNIYGSARGVIVKTAVNHFKYFHLCLAASVFQVLQQQQPSKRLGCHGTTAAHQVFPFVTATNGASPYGFVLSLIHI